MSYHSVQRHPLHLFAAVTRACREACPSFKLSDAQKMAYEDSRPPRETPESIVAAILFVSRESPSTIAEIPNISKKTLKSQEEKCQFFTYYQMVRAQWQSCRV
jgi:hypothetical protein